MDPNKPRSREKNVTSGGSGVHRRGSGLGTGPVGSSNGYSGRSESGGGGGKRAAIGGGGAVGAIAIIMMLLKSCNLGGVSDNAGTAPGGDILPNHASVSEQYIADDGGAVDTTVAEGSRA